MHLMLCMCPMPFSVSFYSVACDITRLLRCFAFAFLAFSFLLCSLLFCFPFLFFPFLLFETIRVTTFRETVVTPGKSTFVTKKKQEDGQRGIPPGFLGILRGRGKTRPRNVPALTPSWQKFNINYLELVRDHFCSSSSSKIIPRLRGL